MHHFKCPVRKDAGSQRSFNGSFFKRNIANSMPFNMAMICRNNYGFMLL